MRLRVYVWNYFLCFKSIMTNRISRRFDYLQCEDIVLGKESKFSLNDYVEEYVETTPFVTVVTNHPMNRFLATTGITITVFIISMRSDSSQLSNVLDTIEVTFPNGTKENISLQHDSTLNVYTGTCVVQNHNVTHSGICSLRGFLNGAPITSVSYQPQEQNQIEVV